METYLRLSSPAHITGAFVAVFVLLQGCTTTHYRESADREAYAVIAQKSDVVPGLVKDFSIDSAGEPDFADAPVNDAALEYLGDEGKVEVGAKVLSLEKALAVAFKYSREYQARKERVYLQALNLTLDRHRFTPIFAASASGDYRWTTRDTVQDNALGAFLAQSPQVAANIEALTGSPADLFNEFANVVAAAGALTGANTTNPEIVNERSVDGGASVGMNVLLRGGGRVALNLTTNLLQFLTGNPRESAASVLSGSFVQPLLRGAGRDVAAETLTQAERDLLYELRDFGRFRQTFAVRVATQYYNVLNNLAVVEVNYRGMKSFERNLDREEAFAAEGQRTRAEVGRFEQQVLSRQASWIASIRRYKQTLDTFKILLGLSTDSAFILDQHELETLTERGIIHPSITPDDATKVALVTRLDLYTQRDRVDDAVRRVKVNANSLKPQLDLIFAGSVDSQDGNQALDPDFDRSTWSAGLDADLGLDRKAERNAYRASLIALESGKRDLELAEDEIKLDVREAWRALEQEKTNFEINQQAVALNERRVEEQNLRFELGLGVVIDQVDAENDLINSQNGLTNSLISHTIARLQFWQDIGVLFIKENGQWEEVTDVHANQS